MLWSKKSTCVSRIPGEREYKRLGNEQERELREWKLDGFEQRGTSAYKVWLRFIAPSASHLWQWTFPWLYRINKSFAILVELELGDDDLGGVDADIDSGSVNLLPYDVFHVDDPLVMVHLNHLPFALVCPTHHLHWPDVVLVPQVGKIGALISTRWTLDGAKKCAFWHLRRVLKTCGLYFMDDLTATDSNDDFPFLSLSLSGVLSGNEAIYKHRRWHER